MFSGLGLGSAGRRDGEVGGARRRGRLCFENGYETLSIPAISAAAGVSNQTFYDHFAGKQEAFLAGFDLLAEDALRVVAGAITGAGEMERAEAVAAGIRGLLDHAVTDELYRPHGLLRPADGGA